MNYLDNNNDSSINLSSAVIIKQYIKRKPQLKKWSMGSVAHPACIIVACVGDCSLLPAALFVLGCCPVSSKTSSLLQLRSPSPFTSYLCRSSSSNLCAVSSIDRSNTSTGVLEFPLSSNFPPGKFIEASLRGLDGTTDCVCGGESPGLPCSCCWITCTSSPLSCVSVSEAGLLGGNSVLPVSISR